MTEQDDLTDLGRIGIIGAGAAGGALARALSARGARVVAVAARTVAHARALAAALPGAVAPTDPAGVCAASDLVFLAVPDDALPSVAATLSWRAGQGAIHLSGVRGAEALAPAAARGAATAALHPLMTFARADPREPASAMLQRLAGCAWALESGDAALGVTLERLVAALGGHTLRLGAQDRVPYHLAAVLASNYVVALMGGAARLWETFGMPADAAVEALAPLLRAAVGRITDEGLPRALSGPIARGDVGTVAAHLAWLEARASGDPHWAALRDAYVALGRLAIPLAEAKGTLTPDGAHRLRAALGGDPNE